MSTVCEFCNHTMNKDNVYGTFCIKCNKYLQPSSLPKFVLENQRKLLEHQQIIRMFMRKKILGESNGN